MSGSKASSATLTRRATLKGAGVAVGTLWVAPMIQMVSMDSAAAASAPPSRVQTTTSQVGAVDGEVTTASAEVGAVEGAVLTASDALPKTGSDSTAGLTAAGLGAVVVGGAAVYASKRRRGAKPGADDTAAPPA